MAKPKRDLSSFPPAQPNRTTFEQERTVVTSDTSATLAKTSAKSEIEDDDDEEPTNPNIVLPFGKEGTQSFESDWGIVAPLMRNSEVTEIMVNDLRSIAFEQGGRIFEYAERFQKREDLELWISRLMEKLGRDPEDQTPQFDGRLPNGSRIHVILPPLTQDGPSITIRKFPMKRTLEELVRKELLRPEVAYFLNACVIGKINLVISGASGSGKSTLLNALVAKIPRSERVITIEDTPELVTPQSNSVHLLTNDEHRFSQRELIATALRMRPDRIIVGECRQSETLDMLQAMNTGHMGSMTTLHANSPRDALSRIESLCLLNQSNLNPVAIKKQIAQSVQLLIHVTRNRSGSRKIVSITEVTGFQGESISTQEIFAFDSNLNRVVYTGLRPELLTQLEEQGLQVSSSLV